MLKVIPGLAIVILLGAPSSPTLAARPQAPSCESQPEFAQLDFWVGNWDVFVGDQRVGEDHIQKIMDGCAITEDWKDARGGQGHSLFYIEPASMVWKQVWVTQRALAPGGLKEKQLIARLPNGALRFQGQVAIAGGQSYLDRTLLEAAGPAEVHQLIEISRDGGQTWQTTFDAMYRRRS
jgi:hypothetical protein